ncbi:sugar phosphate isomerase/epimerase [Actinomadura sp. KC345]|uniref:sugar phosphate isomerase/epimerase family protein n=1 Tax=Actinomadura sp. KC345 TaxID=2530371 RepID=UPI001FB73AA4|nr:sugar phosphate isomerase/epimerase [Actinomadura sp. KC345]
MLPQGVGKTFELATKLGYNGVEIMPTVADPSSWRLSRLRELQDRYPTPVTSIHAPCLGPQTAGVWGRDPWGKLQHSVAVAEALGAGVVVVHPPFWWQRAYAATFVETLAEMQDGTDVRIAVENLYPRGLFGYRPHWNPAGTRWTTLDVSHAAASRDDAVTMAEAMGDRLTHVHLSDSVTGRDLHMVPGRGDQRCDALVKHLAKTAYTGDICIEVNTSSVTPAERRRRLYEARAFVTRHWPSLR